MEKDRVTESYDWVYGWKVEDGKCVPPAKNHPLPEFVQKRIDWVSNEIQKKIGSLGLLAITCLLVMSTVTG